MKLPCALMLLAISTVLPAAKTPNVVLIFCDDLGYNDIGCFGSEKHRTPNIDQLAKEGRRFTSFYVSAPVCTPSRASLMTGCYPRRVSMQTDARGGWVLFPRARKGLNPKEITIAEVLKKAGYRTACVGKWHLGDQQPFLPRKQGFDEYFGIPYSNDMGTRQRRPDRNPPLPLMRNETVIEAPADQTQLTRKYTEEAIKFIEANKSGPFFLYLPHTFPHVPLFASEKFRGKSKNKKFGDAVEEIDWSTGQILDTLDRLKIAKNTLVIFTSDNGAQSGPGGSNKPLRGRKGTTWEGGMRVCCAMRWPGKIPAGTSCDEMCLSMDLMPTIAQLAGTSAPTDRKIDGKPIQPLMFGKEGAKTPHDVFYYYRVSDLQAVRSGDWKMHLPRMEGRGKNRKQQELLLFNLKDDIGEKTNVADQHPEIIARLKQLAAKAVLTLGDGKQKGSEQRPAAFVEKAVPLLKSE